MKIDEDIIEVINILNTYNYKTYFSCSSHVFEGKNKGYIFFEYNERVLNFLLYLLDNMSSEIIRKLNLKIEIKKYQPKYILNIDKSMCLRFSATIDNYTLLLEMFEHTTIIVKEYNENNNYSG